MRDKPFWKYCDDDQLHLWVDDAPFISSDYEPELESGMQTCGRCGLRRHAIREVRLTKTVTGTGSDQP